MRFFKKRPYVLFILPAFLIYSVFAIYPVVSVLPYSLTEWSGIGPIQVVGIKNFITILTTPWLVEQMKNAFKNTYFLLLLTYVIYNPLIIVGAYFLFRKIKGNSIYKAVMFMPQFVNAIAVTFMVTLFFSPNIGLYKNVMQLLGLGKWGIPGIWENLSLGVPLVLLVGVWRGMGYEMLLYIANFSTVPEELDQAAKIDGAGEVKRFFHVYFPLVAPTFTNVIVLMYIWTLTTFDIPFLLGGVDGGVNGSMDTIQLFFYRTVFGSSGYRSNFMGMGSALSSIILIALVSGSLLLQRYLSRRETTY